jgi:predicted LPLAT superfamily acyltransferase
VLSEGAGTVNAETQLHWKQEKEQVHSSRPIRLLILLVSSLPPWMVNILVFPVAFFYFICSKRGRTEAVLYQKQFIAYTNGKRFKLPHPYLQILSFSLCILEKIEGWSGKIALDEILFQHDDIDELKTQLMEGTGALLIGSHLGNIELCRSLASFNRTGINRAVPVIAIMDVEATEQFNKTINNMNPDVSVNIVNPADIGVDTMSRLIEHTQKGGLVVIAADRTSASVPERSFEEPFLGRPALFPYGPFLIAALLNVPTYFVFAMRKGNAMIFPKYNMYIKKADVTFDCSRPERENRIRILCRLFVKELEKYCIKYPFQWYNFYNFWAMPETDSGR